MTIRDYWMTAVGRDGGPVPVPVELRTPTRTRIRAAGRNGLVASGFIAVAGMVLIVIKSGGLGELPSQVTNLALSSIGGGLFLAVSGFVVPALIWPFQRRLLGERLEATAEGWSSSELDRHIQDIRLKHDGAEGRTKVLHARHLAWLEARRSDPGDGTQANVSWGAKAGPAFDPHSGR